MSMRLFVFNHRSPLLAVWILSPLWILASGFWLLSVHAQELRTPACLTETYNRLGTSERTFRSVVLGQRPAAKLPIGAVRYDRNGNLWRKKGPSVWRTLAEGFTGTTWSDTHMDAQAEFAARKGILEAKKTMTSDLIPDLLQAVRAFQCETQRDCMAAQDSIWPGEFSSTTRRQSSCFCTRSRPSRAFRKKTCSNASLRKK